MHRSSQAPRFFEDFRLERQFERRRKDFKPNLTVQAEAPLYRVDAVISGEYVPPNEENCIEIKCYDGPVWQQTLHGNESDCP